MAETGQLSEAESREAEKLPVRLAPPVTTANKAPYFVDFVKAELIRQLKDRMTEEEITQAGLKIYSTLHVPMNQAAQRAVARGIDQLEKSAKAPLRIEGALASVDHSTGFLRALVGGKDYARSTFNRILNMKRQVGSTFKPIVYLTALAKRNDSNGVPYGPAYPMEDSPWTLSYDRGRQTWSPKNYEPEFRGWITLRQALAHSTNTIAARLGHEVGIGKVIETAHELGIESPLPEVPSLALGVAELSPVELLKAYATIAHHGVQDELTAIRAITADDGSIFARFVYHPQLIFEPGPADLISDMMTSVFTDGTASPTALRLNFTRPAAGKTGTTSNHRDSWFAGFTPQLTSVVWVGVDPQGTAPGTTHSPGEKKGKVILTGASAALPIWIDFMKSALADEPPSQFPVSTHLKRIRIDRHSGRRASAECPDPQLLEENYLEEAESGDSACLPTYPNTLPSEVRSDLAIEPGASMADPTPREE
jgi:penicillin-binding protein 1A